MIKCIIVDDEKTAIKALEWELQKFDDNITISATFTSPEKALGYINKEAIDCVFLDIQMQSMTGFEFLKQLGNDYPAIIITSAFNKYALKAIKEEVLDYLLKPIDHDDLKKCIEKLIHHTEKTTPNEQFERFLLEFDKNNHQKKICLQTDGKILFLEPDTISHVVSDGNYSTLFLGNDKKIVLTKKLKEIEDLLSKKSFYRVHNSYIINLNKIKEYIKSDSYIVLENNIKIPVSRQKKSGFLNSF